MGSKLKFDVPRSIMTEYDAQNRNANKILNISFDEKVFNDGHQWYYNGFKLEEAEEHLRTNKNFVNGYNRASRLASLEKRFYALGESYFNKGLSLEEIPDTYKNNETVLKGYEEAKINRRKK